MKKTVLLIFYLFTLLSTAQTSLIWAKQMGGTNNEFGNSIAVDSLGNVYTKGYFRGVCDFDPGPGTLTLSASTSTNEVYISKLDAAGNFVWVRNIGKVASDGLNALVLDRTGNIYCTGSFAGTVDFDPGPGTFSMTPTGNTDIFILKLNSSGNFVWVKKIGGSSIDNGYSVTVDSYNNVYTTGNFSGSVDFDPGPGSYSITTITNSQDDFISKLDSAGNFILAKSIAGNNSTINNITGNSIKVDKNNNIFITGLFSGVYDFDPGSGVMSFTSSLGNNNNDDFILKLDAIGNFVWAKQIGGVYDDGGSGLVLDADGNIYTTGYYSNQVDFDPGNGTFTLTAEGGKDIFISKLDSAGNFVWAKTIGGVYDDFGRSIALDVSNNIYTAGSFSLAADFDPGPGISYLSTYGYANGFILKLYPSGNFDWAGKIGGPDYNTDAKSIFLDEHSIYTTGYFSAIVDFDCGPGTYTLASINNTQDIFVQKMDFTTLGIKENKELYQFTMYPIPVNDILNIEVENEELLNSAKSMKIKLIDALGRSLSEQNVNSNKIEVDTKNIKSGLYFIELQNANKTILTKKIIKL